MDVALKIPVVEGGPAGSGVFEATISTDPEQHGGAALGNILKELLLRCLAGSRLRVLSRDPAGRSQGFASRRS
jgi:hypothetical protein